jgi:branched-chain amino acid transport system ATP-binding protein
VIELGITHVQEGSRLFNQMTVLDNLKLGAYTSRAWRRRKENFENVYRIFPILKDRKNQTVWTLSGGERRMCAIGKGLMSEPKLLMLDEPSLGLAPIVCKQLFEHILRIRESGLNILLIEQKTTYVSEVANDVCLVNKGRVVLSGPVDKVLRHDYVKEAYFGRTKTESGYLG